MMCERGKYELYYGYVVIRKLYGAADSVFLYGSQEENAQQRYSI